MYPEITLFKRKVFQLSVTLLYTEYEYVYLISKWKRE